MSAKHTPGPWFYGIAYEPERGPVPFDYQAPGYYQNPGIIGANGDTVVGCDEYHVFNSPQDAALIAAAPELLAELRDLVRVARDLMEAAGYSTDAITASLIGAHAVIAKAEAAP